MPVLTAARREMPFTRPHGQAKGRRTNRNNVLDLSQRLRCHAASLHLHFYDPRVQAKGRRMGIHHELVLVLLNENSRQTLASDNAQDLLHIISTPVVKPAGPPQSFLLSIPSKAYMNNDNTLQSKWPGKAVCS